MNETSYQYQTLRDNFDATKDATSDKELANGLGRHINGFLSGRAEKAWLQGETNLLLNDLSLLSLLCLRRLEAIERKFENAKISEQSEIKTSPDIGTLLRNRVKLISILVRIYVGRKEPQLAQTEVSASLVPYDESDDDDSDSDAGEENYFEGCLGKYSGCEKSFEIDEHSISCDHRLLRFSVVKCLSSLTAVFLSFLNDSQSASISVGGLWNTRDVPPNLVIELLDHLWKFGKQFKSEPSNSNVCIRARTQRLVATSFHELLMSLEDQGDSARSVNMRSESRINAKHFIRNMSQTPWLLVSFHQLWRKTIVHFIHRSDSDSRILNLTKPELLLSTIDALLQTSDYDAQRAILKLLLVWPLLTIPTLSTGDRKFSANVIWQDSALPKFVDKMIAEVTKPFGFCGVRRPSTDPAVGVDSKGLSPIFTLFFLVYLKFPTPKIITEELITLTGRIFDELCNLCEGSKKDDILKTRIIVQIFSENDDHFIQLLSSSLDIFGASRRANFQSSFSPIHPTRLLLEFLRQFDFDCEIFLDWLTSEETKEFVSVLESFLEWVVGDLQVNLIGICERQDGNTLAACENDDSCEDRDFIQVEDKKPTSLRDGKDLERLVRDDVENMDVTVRSPSEEGILAWLTETGSKLHQESLADRLVSCLASLGCKISHRTELRNLIEKIEMLERAYEEVQFESNEEHP